MIEDETLALRAALSNLLHALDGVEFAGDSPLASAIAAANLIVGGAPNAYRVVTATSMVAFERGEWTDSRLVGG